MKKHIYHYHAQRQAGNQQHHTDGIALMTLRIVDMDGYRELKKSISPESNLIITSLSYLGREGDS
jgi:hypothetical protein